MPCRYWKIPLWSMWAKPDLSGKATRRIWTSNEAVMDMVQAVILDLIQGLGEFLSLSALGADHSGGGAGGGSGACRQSVHHRRGVPCRHAGGVRLRPGRHWFSASLRTDQNFPAVCSVSVYCGGCCDWPRLVQVRFVNPGPMKKAPPF